jgi:hypothetical protein
MLPLALLLVGCGGKGAAPKVLSIVASNNSPASGEQVQLSVQTDSGSGFRKAEWTADAGRFAGSQATTVETNTPEAFWTAPKVSVETTVTVSVKVTNFRGNTDTSQFKVLVQPTGAAQRVQITGFTFAKGGPVITAGDQVQATVKTSGGTPAQIQWSVAPVLGSLAIRSGDTVTWMSPDSVAADTKVQLRATVTDEAGLNTTDYVEVTVQPKAPAALKARIVTLSGSKAVLAPGDQVDFTVTVADSASVRDIRWTVLNGVGTLLVDRGPKAQWIAPSSVSADTTAELGVTVYDVNGGQDTGSTKVIVKPSISGGGSTSSLPKITGFTINPAGVIKPNDSVSVTVDLSNTSVTPDVAWTVIAAPGSPNSVLSVSTGKTAIWIAPAAVTSEAVYRLQATVTSAGLEGREQGFVDLVVRPSSQ